MTPAPEDSLPAPRERVPARASGAGFHFPDLSEDPLPVSSPQGVPAGDAESVGPRRRHRPRPRWEPRARPAFLRYADPALRWGVILLLLFAPLAAGSVEAWSGMVVVAGSVALSLLWIARETFWPEAAAAEREAESHSGSWSAGLDRPLAAFLLLGVIQVLPLGPLVGFASPVAAEVWRLAGVPVRAMRLSLGPEATLLSLAHGAAMALLFFAVLNTLRGRAEVRLLTLAVVTLGFGLALFGIFRHFLLWGTAYWQGSGATSSFGPYVNRNHFAGLMGLVIPLGVGYLLSLGERRRDRSPAAGAAPQRRAGAGHEVRSQQVLVGFMVAVMTGALFLSLSRGGIVSTVLAVAFLGALLSLRRTGGRHGWAVPVALALASGAWLGAQPLLGRLSSLGLALHDPAGDIRPRLWGDVLRFMTDFPLFGSGLGTFGGVFPRYQTVMTSLNFVHAHNDWLQLVAETGLAGTLALAVLAARFVSRIRRRLGVRRDGEAVLLALGGLAGLVAFLFHAFTEFNFHIPANALWFTVIAALTLKAVASKI